MKRPIIIAKTVAKKSRLFELMRQNKPIPVAEECALARKAVRGNAAARDKLVICNLRFVALLVRPYAAANPCVPWDDLMHYGITGMLRALPKFDPGRGLRFMTYAGPWIQTMIDRGVAVGEVTVRDAPKDVRKSAKGFRTLRIVSIDEPLPGTEDLSLLDLLPSNDTPVDAVAARAQHIGRIRARLAKLGLDDRDRDILRSRLMTDDPEPLAVIGSRHGVSRERIRQLEVRLRARLRESLADLAA